MATVACPHCQQRYRVTPEIADKQVNCQKCGKAFFVPPLASVANSPATAIPATASTTLDELAAATAAPVRKPAPAGRAAAGAAGSNVGFKALVIGVAAGVCIALGCGALAVVLLLPKLTGGGRPSERQAIAAGTGQPMLGQVHTAQRPAPSNPTPSAEPPAVAKTDGAVAGAQAGAAAPVAGASTPSPPALPAEPAPSAVAESPPMQESPTAAPAESATAVPELGSETVAVQQLVPLGPAKPAASAPAGQRAPSASPATAKAVLDDSPLGAESLDLVKHATVFVRVKRAQGMTSGSGFVIAVDNGRAVVATNHHVVGHFPEPSGQSAAPGSITPRAVAAELKQADIEVVFDSGTKSQRSAKGQVLAADLVHDLALLRVDGVANLPQPLDLSEPPQLLETMPIYSFGFPFGDVLATSKGNAAVTVGKGTISSLRLDDDGKLALVQIDGSINPGNSGGPIVTSHGKLVGVAVATIRNSSGIGLAIPAEQIPLMLAGHAGPGCTALITRPDGKTVLRVEHWLVDPYSKIKSVALHYLLAEAGQPDPDGKSALASRPGCRKLKLTLDKHVAYAEIPVAASEQGKKLFAQVVVENDAGPQVTAVSNVVLNPPQAVQPPGATTGPTRPRLVIQLPRHPGQRVRIRRIPGSPGGPIQPGAPGQPGAGQPALDKHVPGDATEILCGGVDARFREQAPEGALLVGLDVGVGNDPRNDWSRALRAIYRHGDQQTYSPWHGIERDRVVRLVARPGYAVGGTFIKPGGMVDGLCLVFMRIKGNQLDPDDAYFSQWAGHSDGPTAEFLSGDGRPVVGIIGRENAHHTTGLGLQFRKSAGAAGMTFTRHQVPMPDTPKACGSQSVLVGNQGCARYHDASPPGSLLVGLEIGLNVVGDNEFLAAMRPIYREGDQAPMLGTQHGVKWDKQIRVAAKPGYAVGAMRVRSGMNADGLRLTFMRIKGDQLDTTDRYESDWIGDKRPGDGFELTGQGHPVCGLIGAADDVHNYGIGLLFHTEADPKE